MPLPAQLAHFGSSSLTCVLTPVPEQSTHFPSPLQYGHAPRFDLSKDVKLKD